MRDQQQQQQQQSSACLDVLSAYGSKQPSAPGLPLEHPLQPCDSEQAWPEGQYAQTYKINITRLHDFPLPAETAAVWERGGGRGGEHAHAMLRMLHSDYPDPSLLFPVPALPRIIALPETDSRQCNAEVLLNRYNCWACHEYYQNNIRPEQCLLQ